LNEQHIANSEGKYVTPVACAHSPKQITRSWLSKSGKNKNSH
jgi:hypothetical protein